MFLEGFTLRNGNSSSSGGGLYAVSNSSSGPAGSVTLTNNIITGNVTENVGGGVFVAVYSSADITGSIVFTHNTITGNTADSTGGGAHTYSNSSSAQAGDVSLLGNTVMGNTTSSHGGGVYAYSASYEGVAGDLTLSNNTVTGNTANGYGGGVTLDKRGNIINVYNNIIWGNVALAGGDIDLFGTGTANGYNNDYLDMLGYWTNSEDNITADPLFVNVSDPDPANWDLHLHPTSPCVDAGTNSAPDLPATDFEGDPRIIDGDNDGTATVDMGADEYFLPYAILHRDGALWFSETGWELGKPPYYRGADYARDMEFLADGGYMILHKDGALWSSSEGWVLTQPPYYAGADFACALELVSGGYLILHKDGAFYDSRTGWNCNTPPYYPGSAYAVDLEMR